MPDVRALRPNLTLKGHDASESWAADDCFSISWEPAISPYTVK